jgi:predicted PurR-regulated permease PerM
MENLNKKISIEITSNTIIKILFILAILVVAYLIRGVIVILFFAFILVSIFEPIVAWLKNKKVPKILAVLAIYLILLLLLAVIVILLIPPISSQVSQLRANSPLYWSQAVDGLTDLKDFLNSFGLAQPIQDYLANLSNSTLFSSGLFMKLEGFISGIFSAFVVLVITFYLLVEENAPRKIMKSLLPVDYLPYANQVFTRMEKQLGLWLRGQLILSTIIFILAYLGLSIIGVKYALILAIIAGLCEFIPYLGPSFSGFFAVTLTLLNNPVSALLVLAWYIFMQILQHNIFVPNVMRKVVGINPVISISALLIGATLGGFVGIILALPITIILSVIFQDFLDQKHSEEIKLE